MMKKIIGIITALFLLGTGVGYSVPQQEQQIGAVVPTVIALFETYLQNKISSTATSMTLASATTGDGTTLSGTYGFIIDEGTASEEFVIASCTGTACTSMTRGISLIDGKTEKTALKMAHRRGASVKISNHPNLAILSRIINGSESFANKLYYDSGVADTGAGASSTAIMSKAYIDLVGAGGFTSANIGDGGGLRVNGTAPETLDIATSTTKWFKINSGFFDIDNSATSALWSFWDTRYNATSTKSGNFTFSDNLVVTGNSTTTNATTTGSLYVGGDFTATLPISDYNASDTLQQSADTERSKTDTNYTKVKEIETNVGGTLRVKFDLQQSDGGTVNGRIYKNGVAFGTEQSSTGAYTTKSEDLVFAKNDLIQLYYKSEAGNIVKVRNFRIYYTKSTVAETIVNTD